jgi:hypothetical protein
MLLGSRSHWRTLLATELLNLFGWDAQPGGPVGLIFADQRAGDVVAVAARRSIAMTASCFNGRSVSGCGSGSGNSSIADHS